MLTAVDSIGSMMERTRDGEGTGWARRAGYTGTMKSGTLMPWVRAMMVTETVRLPPAESPVIPTDNKQHDK